MGTFRTAIYTPPEDGLPFLVVLTDGRQVEVHPAKSKKAADALLIVSEARWKERLALVTDQDEHKARFRQLSSPPMRSTTLIGGSGRNRLELRLARRPSRGLSTGRA